MAIRKAIPQDKRELNLDGPQGNAYVLLGYASNWCPQIGLDKKAVCEDMRSGNYANLCAVFDEYFGSIADLVTENEDLIEEIRVAREALSNQRSME